MITLKTWARVLCALFLSTWVLFDASANTQTFKTSNSGFRIQDFHMLPNSHFVTLSPNGQKVAWIEATERASIRHLKILDLPTNQVTKLLSAPYLLNPVWHNSSNALYVNTENTLVFIPVNKRASRKTLLKYDSFLNQKFVKYVPENNGIYFSEEDETSHRIFRLDESGKRTLVLSSPNRIKNFHHFPETNSIFYTLEFSDHTEIIASEHDEQRSLRSCDMLKRCNLLGVNLKQRKLFIDSNLHSRLDSLSSLHLDNLTENILITDPKSVSDREFTFIKNGQPIYTSFFGDYRRFYSPNPKLQTSFNYLAKHFSHKNLTVQFNDDMSLWLLEVTAGNMQLPSYFMFDSTTHNLTDITAKIEKQTVKISDSTLVKPTAMTYPARDGLNIQSYVWLPKNVDLKTAPVITFVHGGPWKRIKGEYDFFTQLLVDNGYIVFQPNFRASWGFGVDFVKAGAKTFGKGDTHNDIIDGIEFLLANQLGHRDKLAIMGHSFGGFSVLGALAFEPDYFKAGFASSAPSQLMSLNSDSNIKRTGRTRPIRGFDRIHQDRVFLFDDRNQSEVDYMQSISPEAHKMAIKAPLIIVAGGKDRKVPITGVKHYALSLKQAGKPVSFYIEKDAPHTYYWDPTWYSLVYLMERFFASHLGGTIHLADDNKYQQHLQQMETFSTKAVSQIYKVNSDNK